ncbi:MAG TPA: ABC transporter substrate-binding protein [Candidatus Tectomicrobia bacterium]|nr:ABC transporter substrate-binding protein [Candidatus Tectomicrobia bacterium]
MRLQQPWWSVVVTAVLLGLGNVTAVAGAGAQFIPVLGGREGALKSVYTPITNGFIDYVTVLNERDGGINGVKLVWEECETVYDVERGVECYERLKGKGPTGAAAFHAVGTPIANALTERATHDEIPLLTVGIGRSDAADGRVFPYVFNPPVTYWSQNTAKIRFIGQRAGGMEQLKGLKIAHIYADNDYGRETIPLLDTQAAQYGFAVQHLAVPSPGLDQKATWLRVKVAQPDWVILRTAGVMTPTALKEAAQVGFPRDKMVGAMGTCSDQEMVPAGDAARGFNCPIYHATGTHFPLIQEILTYVYARGKGAGPESDVGTLSWVRGMVRALLTAEALRTAMREFGHQPLTGAQVQWGLEHLSLTPASLKEMGAEGLIPPITLSCRDHEGGGGVKFQQWDGTQWTVLTDWIAPDQALVRPLVEASAAKYAQEKGLTPRDCP